jgi:predicted nucleotidyltransferase
MNMHSGSCNIDKLVVIESLRSCSKDLESAFGDEFLGLVLFGSWARGEARVNSDVDVLVVLKSLRGLEVRSSIYVILSNCVKRSVTLIDVRVDELFKDVIELTPLMLNIFVDGIAIYDKTGKLSELASKVRQFVNAAGLVRYRTPDGKYGWKKVCEAPLQVMQWPL